MTNEPKFGINEEVYDLIDERLMKICEASYTKREGWRYKLDFDAKVHAFTGSGTWRSESELLARE